MHIVFIGAGAVFWFHSAQWMRAAPKGSRFFVVETDLDKARESRLEVLSIKDAVRMADLAIILTPNYVRRKVCEPFLNNYKPIVVEKPLSINWDEIKWFANIDKHAWICPIANARCLETIEHMHNRIPNPIAIHSWKLRYRNPEYYSGWHGKYATDGGVLAQQGFHCLDLLCWFGGMPISVEAKGFNRKHNIECEDTAEVKIRFANGCIGTMYCTTANEFDGNAGLWVENKDQFSETEAPNFAKGTSGHTILACRVFDALANKREPPITVASMVPSLQTLHAAYVSMDKVGAPTLIGERHDRLGKAA